MEDPNSRAAKEMLLFQHAVCEAHERHIPLNTATAQLLTAQVAILIQLCAVLRFACPLLCTGGYTESGRERTRP